MKKCQGILFCLIFLFAFQLMLIGMPAIAGSEEAILKEIPGIDFKDGFLSVSVNKKKIKDVIKVVANKVGIEVVVPESIDDEVTVNFYKLPPEEGLKKLLTGRNHAFLYSLSDKDSESFTIYKIIIFSDSKDETLPGFESDAQMDQIEEAKRIADKEEIPNQQIMTGPLNEPFTNEEERRNKINKALEQLKQKQLSKDSNQKLSEFLGPDFKEESLRKEIYKSIKQMEY